MFNTNSPNKLYLCEFDELNISFKMLSAYGVVYHHIVKWMPYKPRNKGPTQCYRRLMYGHGITSCNRFIVCMLCSGKHFTKDCRQITKDTQNPQYKCFNCVSNGLPHAHKANDPKCPARLKYEATRKNARISRLGTTAQNIVSNNANTQFVTAPVPPPMNISFAATTAGSSQQSHTHSNTQSNAQSNSQPNTHRQSSSSTHTFESANNNHNNSSELFSSLKSQQCYSTASTSFKNAKQNSIN